jgi:hypothetical protein
MTLQLKEDYPKALVSITLQLKEDYLQILVIILVAQI